MNSLVRKPIPNVLRSRSPAFWTSNSLYSAKKVSLRTNIIRNFTNSADDSKQGKENNNQNNEGNTSKNAEGVERHKKSSVSLLVKIGILISSPILFTLWLQPESGGAGVDPRFPKNTFTEFQDTRILYQTKSTSEIWWNLIIFKLCTLGVIVDNAPKLLDFAEKTFWKAPLYWVIKKTFFAHFCGGETMTEVKETVTKLKENGVSVILDYSTEDAMTKDVWEKNAENVVKTLEEASKVGFQFVPIKVTSLVSPALLERMAEILNYQRIHPEYVVPWNTQSKELQARVKKIIEQDASQAAVPVQVAVTAPAALSAAEVVELTEFSDRMSRIGVTAHAHRVKLLVDAEQTYRQPAVDWIALEMSRRFNRERAIIHNTYQLYLQVSPAKLAEHWWLAQQEEFYLGAKLVRGAYIVTESERAQQQHYRNPIWASKLQTDQVYDENVRFCLHRINQNDHVSLVVATHNLSSVLRALQFMRQSRIDPTHPNVQFAQLQGMADHLTLGLSYMNFNVNKLVPYGPMDSVMPYLVRRLQENRDIMGGTQLERHLLWTELKRRKFVLKD
jgi:proline dehydrogenase